ncbi:MAG TPA: hypothetical protein VFZ89_03305 [Solirubrobacteraceae bacterium]
MRRRTLSLFAIVATVAITAPLAFAASVPDYRKLIFKIRTQSVEGTLGFRCVPTPQGADCPTEQPKYPLKTTGVVKVRQGDQITLLFGAPVGDVSWWTARVNAQGKEVPTAQGIAKLPNKRSKKRWRIDLPKSLRKSSKILGVLAQSPNAQASFEVGLQVRSAR